MNTKTETDADRTIRTIARQWRGGEHVMAGKRASQFIYGTGTPDDALLERVKAEIPGIEPYISAPVITDPDQGDEPVKPRGKAPKAK